MHHERLVQGIRRLRRDRPERSATHRNLDEADLKAICERLKHSSAKQVSFTSSEINPVKIHHITNILKDTVIYRLCLNDNCLGSDGIKILAAALIHSEIRDLDLRGNGIGDNGFEYFAQILKYTKITHLHLARNNISNRGVKHLVDNLRNNQELYIDLRDNPITTDAAQDLCWIFSCPDVFLAVHVNFKDTEGCIEVSSQSCSIKSKNLLTFTKGSLGKVGATFINMIVFNALQVIDEMSFGLEWSHGDDIEYVLQALRDVQVGEFQVMPNVSDMFLKYQIQALQSAYMKTIVVNEYGEYINGLIKEINFIRLKMNTMGGDEILRQLAPALKGSTILDLDLPDCYITDDGAKYLSKALKNTQVTRLNLDSNYITDSGAKWLARALRDSQLLEIRLLDDPLVIPFNTKMTACIDSYAESVIPSKVNYIKMRHVANELCKIWQSIVSISPASGEFEFSLPNNNPWVNSVDMDQYVFLIDVLIRKKNIRAHIFNMCCKADGEYDLALVHKLRKFLDALPQQFNIFFNNNVFNLLPEASSFLYFLKRFEVKKQTVIVQNLLLHRQFYYIDRVQEILHPYVYILLHKYQMGLTRGLLEPWKKYQIIRYFQNHSEMDGAREVIDLFLSL